MILEPEVESLFHDLADLNKEERSRYFAEHPTDPATQSKVEALLACDEPSVERLNRLIGQQIESVLMDKDEAIRLETCGPYRLLKVLGRGGMSEVWLADRVDGMLNRPVALKLPHAGFRAAHFAERLRRERNILAPLEHKGIARLYDAGISAEGQPYLALEYIDGVNLMAHCNQNRLTVKQRLLLFLQVLEAVQFAHSRLVIHRDLKPSNILVTPAGEVKLLDFGIAKLMTEGEAHETELTQMEGRALTPSFASPEQIAGRPVTTASDVFSLGLILFELITGGRPFIPGRETRGAVEEAILNENAHRPSQMIAADAQAQERATSKRKLEAALKGDLDLITLKAIQKSPEERYATADAFRADIQRHLDGEAVMAQPESVGYRFQKFVLRNKLAVMATALVIVALGGGLSIAVWQAGIAKREARTAETLQKFTEDIFRINSRANPDPVKAQQTTARQLLDMGAKQVSKGLSDAPEAKLRMLEMLASLYQDLGLEDKGVELQKERVNLLRKMGASDSPELADALIDLASCMHASRSVNESQAVLFEAESILDKRGDHTSETRGRLLSFLAENYTSSDVARAAKLARESIEVYKRWPASRDYATALFTASFAYVSAGQYADAETSSKEAIDLSKRFNGDPNPDLPRYYAHAAGAQLALMHYGEAEQSFRKAYEYAKKLGGDSDIDTLETESRLGTFLVSTSRSNEALPYLRAAVTECIRTKGADDPFYTPQMELQYGEGLDANGQPEAALAQISRAVNNRREHRPGTAYLAQMLRDQARVFTEMGRYSAAGQSLAEADSILHKVNGKPGDYLGEHVRLAMAEGRLDEATKLVDRAEKSENAAVPVSIGGLRILGARAEIALKRRDGAAASSLADRLQEKLHSAQLERYLNVWRVRALVYKGSGYLLLEDPKNAALWLQQAVDAQVSLLDAHSPERAATEAMLGTAYLKCGNGRKAIDLLANARSRQAKHLELSDEYRRPVSELARELERSN